MDMSVYGSVHVTTVALWGQKRVWDSQEQELQAVLINLSKVPGRTAHVPLRAQTSFLLLLSFFEASETRTFKQKLATN